VQFVNYWGITDQGSWLGAPAGLVDVHGSAKPAYEALRRLIKQEWWVPPTGLRTDSEGRVSVRGWAGEYTVSGAGGAATFELQPGSADLDVTLST
jgi:hypothetical protein